MKLIFSYILYYGCSKVISVDKWCRTAGVQCPVVLAQHGTLRIRICVSNLRAQPEASRYGATLTASRRKLRPVLTARGLCHQAPATSPSSSSSQLYDSCYTKQQHTHIDVCVYVHRSYYIWEHAILVFVVLLYL